MSNTDDLAPPPSAQNPEDPGLKVGPCEDYPAGDPCGPLNLHPPTARQPRHLTVLPDSPPEPVRYSLRELMILMALAAVLLAPIRLVGAAVYAAVTGMLAFAILVFISIARPQRGIVHVGWWILLVIYLTAAVATLFSKDV